MPQQIEVPGMGIVEFPDGMTDEQIASALRANMPNQYSVAPDSTAGNILSTLDNIEATPYIGPVVKGIRDVTKGGAQLLAHGINAVAPSILSDQDLQGVDNDVRVSERNYQNSRAERGADGIDLGRVAGGVLATAPVLPMKAASLPATMAKSAAASGGVAALHPVTEGGNFWTEKAKQAGIGATIGAAFPAIGNVVSRVIQPKIDPMVKALMGEGVTPTPGQIIGGGVAAFEDKLTSLPLIGDMIKGSQKKAIDEFNRAAYSRALKGIGEAPETVGREGVEAVKDTLGNAYKDLLPKLQFKADQQFSQELGNLTNLAKNLPEPQAKQFEKIVKDKLVARLGPQGTMDGQALKGVESELSSIARGYRGDSSFDNRQLGDAVTELLSSVRGALTRTNPQYADELSKINQGYANYARIRDAASRVREGDTGFTPAQLAAAVRAADKSVGKGSYATGKALMQDLSDSGKSVLGAKYPDSGTVGRGLAVGSALSSGPAAILAYNNPIAAALTLGAGAASMAPYTPMGRKIAAAILAKRPKIAEPIADAVSAASPALGAAATAGLLSN